MGSELPVERCLNFANGLFMVYAGKSAVLVSAFFVKYTLRITREVWSWRLTRVVIRSSLYIFKEESVGEYKMRVMKISNCVQKRPEYT